MKQNTGKNLGDLLPDQCSQQCEYLQYLDQPEPGTAHLSIVRYHGDGKDVSLSLIAQECQPSTQQILHVGTIGFQNDRVSLKKKTIYENTRYSPKFSFLCGTTKINKKSTCTSVDIQF